MIIHPNGSYPHSHVACPIFVISRLMRLEVRIYLLEHLVTIHFECHIVRSIKSLIDVHKYTQGVKQENFSATKLGIFVKINVLEF